MLQWGQQSKPTALLKKKHATYLCLAKSSSGHAVASTFIQISLYLFGSNVESCVLSVSALNKADVAVRDCTSLGYSGSMYALVFKQWEQSQASVALRALFAVHTAGQAKFSTSLKHQFQVPGTCVCPQQSFIIAQSSWRSAVALAWAPVGACMYLSSNCGSNLLSACYTPS